MIRLEGLSCGYGARAVLEDINLRFERGKMTVLAGVNGCGKSTLIKTAARLLPPLGGRVLLEGRDIAGFAPREFARAVAVLPQSRDVPATTVASLVSHGRFPHLGFARSLGKPDRDICDAAMESAGILELRHRGLASLSGGQRQRAYIAMALAQDAQAVFLDEPTTFLDIGSQFEILELLRHVNAAGKTVVLSLHDLPSALRFGDRLAVFGGGGLLRCGSPEEIYDSGVLETAFGVKIRRAGGSYYCEAE